MWHILLIDGFSLNGKSGLKKYVSLDLLGMNIIVYKKSDNIDDDNIN